MNDDAGRVLGRSPMRSEWGDVPAGDRGASFTGGLIGLALVLALAGVAIGAVSTRSPGLGVLSTWPGYPAIAGTPPGAAMPTPGTAPSPPPAPLPPLPNGPLAARVGLQVGHWRSEELPDELAKLRDQRGASAGGWDEVDVNLEVAQRVAEILAAYGVTVDILPATVPPGYRADAFVAVHCDANNNPGMGGYKLTRYRESAVPGRADALVATVGASYAAVTGLPPDEHVTRAMLWYYAFNAQDFRHAIDPRTPATIIELGFLTNPSNRSLLTGQTDLVARGLAEGLLRFLATPAG